MEYASARIEGLPVTVWVKVAKSAASISLAVDTGTEKESQSPAGKMIEAVMACEERKDVKREVGPAEERRNSSTCRNKSLGCV